MRENNPAGRARHAFEIYLFDPLTLESCCWNVFVQNKETKKKQHILRLETPPLNFFNCLVFTAHNLRHQ